MGAIVRQADAPLATPPGQPDAQTCSFLCQVSSFLRHYTAAAQCCGSALWRVPNCGLVHKCFEFEDRAFWISFEWQLPLSPL